MINPIEITTRVEIIAINFTPIKVFLYLLCEEFFSACFFVSLTSMVTASSGSMEATIETASSFSDFSFFSSQEF